MLSLHCCTGFSLVARSRGYSLVLEFGLLIVLASLFAEHRLYTAWASAVAACGLSSCGSRALEHRLNSLVPGL